MRIKKSVSFGKFYEWMEKVLSRRGNLRSFERFIYFISIGWNMKFSFLILNLKFYAQSTCIGIVIDIAGLLLSLFRCHAWFCLSLRGGILTHSNRTLEWGIDIVTVIATYNLHKFYKIIVIFIWSLELSSAEDVWIWKIFPRLICGQILFCFFEQIFVIIIIWMNVNDLQ